MSFVAPKYTTDEIAYQSLKEKQSALVSAIQTETDPNERAQLVANLRDVEVNLAGADKEVALSKINDKNDMLYSAARSYRVSADALMEKLVDNEGCLRKHPQLAESIGTVGLALSQSATLGFSTDGISILVGAGIYTATRLIQYIQDEENAKALRKLSRQLGLSDKDISMMKAKAANSVAVAIDQLKENPTNIGLIKTATVDYSNCLRISDDEFPQFALPEWTAAQN